MMGLRPRRPSLTRVAAALTVFTILPVAAVAVAGIGHAAVPLAWSFPADAAAPPLYGTAGFDAATIDALQRGWASQLFASFEFAHGRVRGSFVEFGYDAVNGSLTDVIAKGPETQVLLMPSIRIDPFSPITPPGATGPRFAASASNFTIEARDGPMSVLEFRTSGTERRVVFQLPPEVTAVETQWRPDAWPAPSVSFSMGDTRGLLALGFGTFDISEMTVTARMSSTDLLVFESIPAFSAHRTEKIAFVDAIASGRLAAGLSLVAMTNGKWIQIADQYRLALSTVTESVLPRHASVRLNASAEGGAVVLLAFDPQTMPVDGSNRLVVRANGEELPVTNDTLGTFYASAAERARPFYARLLLQATVVAVYLPSLHSISVEVESVAPPAEPVGLDAVSEGAMVVALGIVSIAAAYMFRRKRAG